MKLERQSLVYREVINFSGEYGHYNNNIEDLGE